MSCPGLGWPFLPATYGAGGTLHIHVSYRPTREYVLPLRYGVGWLTNDSDEISEEALNILSANVQEVHGVRRQNLLSPEMPEVNSGREEGAQSPIIPREAHDAARRSRYRLFIERIPAMVMPYFRENSPGHRRRWIEVVDRLLVENDGDERRQIQEIRDAMVDTSPGENETTR